jgi:hypothetical protein
MAIGEDLGNMLAGGVPLLCMAIGKGFRCIGAGNCLLVLMRKCLGMMCGWVAWVAEFGSVVVTDGSGEDVTEGLWSGKCEEVVKV